MLENTNSWHSGGKVFGIGEFDVEPGIAYALGTLALWAGWISCFGGAYAALRVVFDRSSSSRSTLLRTVGSWAGIAAAGFLISAALLPAPKATGALRLPLVWLMMPFAAWMAATSFVMAATRFIQGHSALNAAENSDRNKAGAIWLVLGIAFLLWHLNSGDPIDILRGAIPLRFTTALSLVLAAVAAIAVMALSAQRARHRGWAKATINHLALVLGSLVFGLPFVWALITSFKEDRDMSSPSGLVWIPRVQEKTPYFDPDDVRVAGTHQGQEVEGSILEKYSDGSAKIDILKPAVLRGLTFVAPAPLNIVPKEIDVVKADFEGVKITGRVIKDLEDGRKRVEVTAPPNFKGRTFEAEPDAVELVRPVGLRWQNYPEALDMLPVETMRGLVFLKNTLIIVILNVIGTLLSSSIVAYAFARMRFPGKNTLFLLLLSTMMLPAAVTLIPTFLIFRWLGWIDTLQPLWAPAFLGSAFNIFLLRQFFMSIPAELEDAAKIDGCTYLRTFWQVMLPQIKPALAVIAIWTFMGAWNNFMGPLIYINSPENMPISYAVQLFQSDRSGEPGLLMAFATMAMLPVLAVFFVAQKYFIEGVTLSGLGGR